MSVPAHVSEITIQVHSIGYMLKCRVLSISGGMIRVSPGVNKVDMFQLNDPVVCMYSEMGDLKFKCGDIKKIDTADNTVEILVAPDEAPEERRIFERYPVSLAVSARRKFSNKRLNFIAKNISEYGMNAISAIDLDMDESIDIDLITGKYMFYFVGKVIWKENIGNAFEYGFQLTHFDVATKSSLEAYLGKLKEEYYNMYKKTK